MIFNQTLPAQGGGGTVETWTLSFQSSMAEDEDVYIYGSDDYGAIEEFSYPASVTTTTACPVAVKSYSGSMPSVFDAQGNEVFDCLTQIDEMTFLVACNVHVYGNELFIGFE